MASFCYCILLLWSAEVPPAKKDLSSVLKGEKITLVISRNDQSVGRSSVSFRKAKGPYELYSFLIFTGDLLHHELGDFPPWICSQLPSLALAIKELIRHSSFTLNHTSLNSSIPSEGGSVEA